MDEKNLDKKLKNMKLKLKKHFVLDRNLMKTEKDRKMPGTFWLSREAWDGRQKGRTC